MKDVTTNNVAETEALGQVLAAQLRPGDVLLLRGELGAGKTAFTRGIAAGLGVEGPVASPTFTLLNCHEGRIGLSHFDLYRLDGDDAFYEAGLEDYIGGNAVAVVEWPERCEGAMPLCRLEINICYATEENERNITFTPMGGFREVTL